MIWATATDDFHLRVDPLPYELIVRGAGATTLASYTTVKQFLLAGTRKSMTAKGQADIAAATALAPLLSQEAKRIGVEP